MDIHHLNINLMAGGSLVMYRKILVKMILGRCRMKYTIDEMVDLIM